MVRDVQRGVLPPARDRSRLPRRCRAAIAAFSLVFFAGLPTTAAAEFARAQLAADAQHFAATMDRAAEAGAAAMARAIGGDWGEQSLMIGLAHLSAAMDAPALADRQWARATDIAERRGDQAALVRTLSGATQTALSLGDYERCIVLADRLSHASRGQRDLVGEAIAEDVLGVVARRLGHLDEALRHEERALALQREAGNAAGAALVLGDLSVVHRDRGDFARALESGLDAIAQREQSGDKLDNAYRNVALLYREIEDAPTARTYFERALDAAEKRGAPSAYATVVGSYASFLNDAGEWTRAEAAAREALAIDTALDDRPHQGLEHLEIGRALLGRHLVDDAAVEFEQALRLGRELGQREIVARALLHASEMALTRRDTLRARGMIDEAIAGLEGARLRPQLAQAYALREQLARAEDDDANALRFAHKYAAEREELLGIRASRQLTAMETRHAREEADQRLALLAKDNELKAARIQTQQLQWRLYAAAVVGLLVLLAMLVWRYRGISRLNHALALRNAEVERQRAALSEANDCLEQQAADLYHAATTDWLTHTDNRRHLRAQLERRLAECARDGRELALLAIDFDHFKQINDLGGHPFGDRVLVAGAAAMRECLDPDDLLGRFGGEEFVAVACDRDPAAALALAERIRAHVAEQLAVLAPELRTMATISIGVARLAELSGPIHVETLLEAADRALYAAKSEGRNRVARYAA